MIVVGHERQGVLPSQVKFAEVKPTLLEVGASISGPKEVKNEYRIRVPESPLFDKFEKRGALTLLKHEYDYHLAIVAEFPEPNA